MRRVNCLHPTNYIPRTIRGQKRPAGDAESVTDGRRGFDADSLMIQSCRVWRGLSGSAKLPHLLELCGGRAGNDGPLRQLRALFEGVR